MKVVTQQRAELKTLQFTVPLQEYGFYLLSSNKSSSQADQPKSEERYMAEIIRINPIPQKCAEHTSIVHVVLQDIKQLSHLRKEQDTVATGRRA